MYLTKLLKGLQTLFRKVETQKQKDKTDMCRGELIETWETKRGKKEKVSFRDQQSKLKGQKDHAYSCLYVSISDLWLMTVGVFFFFLAGFPAGLWLLGYQAHDVDQASLLAEVRKGDVSMTCCSCQQISLTQDWDGVIKGTPGHSSWELLPLWDSPGRPQVQKKKDSSFNTSWVKH